MKCIYATAMRAALWAVVGIICFTPAPAMAGEPAWWTQQKRDCGLPSSLAYNDWDGTCNSSGGSSGSGGSGASGGCPPPCDGGLLGDLLRGIFSPGSGAAEKKDQQARAANDLGLQAYNKGDWVTAITYFNKALEKYPDDPTYRQNLAYAQTNLANQQAREKEERDAAERQRRNKAAADNMQQSIQSFAQTLNAAPVSGGLDFDGRTSGNAPTGNSGGLDFTATVTPPASDPNVAVARDVPSGLPKGLDSAIATAYSSAPPGISDRVRKGFQAVMERDWKVAKAWFQDALNRDPNNAGLKRLIALTDSPQQHDRQPATVEARNEPAGLGGGSNSNGATAPPNKTKPTTTTGTPLQAFDPNESLHIMFPGLEAMEEKEALDYLFGLDPYPPASKSAKAK